MNCKIYPICLGKNECCEKSTFTYRKDIGKTITSAFLVYLLRSEGETVLVDSGPPRSELAEKMRFPKLSGRVSISGELKRLGVRPEDVTGIILSHLHWDHCFNLELFPNAKIYVQERELKHAVCPCPFDEWYYMAIPGDGNPGWFDGFLRFVRIKGDTDILPGLSVMLTPGHSPGSQSVIVDTADGQYAICADLFPLFENFEERIPNGLIHSMEDWYESYDKIHATGAKVLPGHDPAVLELAVYG